jgi:cytochrome P450
MAPEEDMISDLIRAEDRDDRIGDDEIVMMTEFLASQMRA